MGRFGGRGRPTLGGITLLILALLRIPLPIPDYHSLRHHDRCEGEVCSRHNHLLTWHSGVEPVQSEQAVLHWHWVWPGREPTESDEDASGAPVVHADDGDAWLQPTVEFTPPCLRPESRAWSFVELVFAVAPFAPFLSIEGGEPPLRTERAPLARVALGGSHLQRWNC